MHYTGLIAEARYCDSITWVPELPISTLSLNILEAYGINLSITTFSKGTTLSSDPKLLILEFYISNSIQIYQSSFSLIACILSVQRKEKLFHWILLNSGVWKKNYLKNFG